MAFKSPPFWWGYFCLWTVILTSRIRLRFTQRNQKVDRRRIAMGKIKVLGISEREVECDFMKIMISFECVGKNQKDTVSQVMKECEGFLEILKGQKMDISLSDDSITEVNLKENVKGYKAEKTIIAKGLYDATLINVIHEICLRKGFTVTMNVEMTLSKEKELTVRKELLEEALNNSKEAAVLIMQSEGKTQIELSSVDKNDRWRHLAGDCGAGFGGIFGDLFGNFFEETYAAVKTNFSNSNELKAKKERSISIIPKKCLRKMQSITWK